MATETIQIPTAAEAMRDTINRKAKKHKTITLDPDQKYAAVILKLAAAVTQADYASLGSQITAITGIQSVQLLIDGKTPATIPDGEQYRLVTDVHLRQDEVPETP